MTVKPAVGLFLVGENQEIQQLRRGRGSKSVHLTTATQPAQGASRALCGGYPPRPKHQYSGDGPSHSRPWEWTDDDVDCKRCIALARDKIDSGALVFFGPNHTAANKTTSRRNPDAAREAAIRRGVRPAKVPGGGYSGFNGAADEAANAWYGAGCPSLASIALAELAPGEHYPNCDLDNEEQSPGGRCSCYDDERSERDYDDLSPEWTLG